MGSFDGVGDVGLDSLDVAGVKGAQVAVDGEVGLALEAVDGDGSGGGVDGELAAVTQVQEEDLPAGSGGEYAARLGIGQAEFMGERDRWGHGIATLQVVPDLLSLAKICAIREVLNKPHAVKVRAGKLPIGGESVEEPATTKERASDENSTGLFVLSYFLSDELVRIVTR